MAELKFKDSQHIAHACIISAQTAEESLREARKIAQAALCTGPEPAPCGNCRACRKVREGIHPDLIVIGRLADREGKLKREISVEQVRALRSDACVLPNEGKRKVYIIEDADCMNPNAQNAALKLLEEPPNGAMILLCVKNPGLLLSTVRSRCAEINLSSPPAQDDKEADSLSLSYLKTIASGNSCTLMQWCARNEGMDGKEAMDFAEHTIYVITDMLCGRRPDMGIDKLQLNRIIELMRLCVKYLKVNVGAKHIFGLLAVDSLPENKKEEK